MSDTVRNEPAASAAPSPSRWREKIRKAFEDHFIKFFIVGGVALVLFWSSKFIWEDVIIPWHDRYLMNQINSYFNGALEKSANRVGREAITNEAQKIFGKRIDTFASHLFDDVDGVYPISLEYRDDKPAPQSLFYVYADLRKHRIHLTLQRRGPPFNIESCINNSDCRETQNDFNDVDVTERFARATLNDSLESGLERPRGAEKSSTVGPNFPPNIHLLEVRTKGLEFKGLQYASIHGYLIVRRAQAK